MSRARGVLCAIAILAASGCHGRAADRAANAAAPAAPATKLAAPAKGRIPVAFLLTADAEVVDFAGPWGVFEYVSLAGASEPPFELYTVAETSAPIRVSGGMTVVPSYTLADAPPPKIVVIPAEQPPTPAEVEWLKRVAPTTDVTMSVCTGAFVLAHAGLLSGREATTHHNGLGALAAQFPDVKVKRGARFVDDGNISSAGGLTSGTDLALHVVERYYGRDVAEKTATALEYQGVGWKDPDSNVAFAKRPVSTDEHPICPVCEMEVDKKTSTSENYRGRTYYFCSPEDKNLFDAHPDKFVD